MDDSDQVSGGAALPAAAAPAIDAGPPVQEEPEPHLSPSARRGLVAWLAVLATGGAIGLLTGHGDLSVLFAVAGLYVAARAAELDRTWYLFHLAVQWIVPVSGLLVSAGLASYAWTSDELARSLPWILGACLIAALASVALLLPIVAHNLAVLAFRESRTTRVTRLTVRIVLLSFLLAVPLRLLWPELLRLLQERGETLADATSLVSGLAGELAVAFAAIGLGLDRNLRQSFQRLGLRPMRGGHWLVAAAGLAVLVALNSLLEYVQGRWFPELAAADRATVEWMIRDLSPALALVLGLTAGIGEEISMRGALQPRLGLVLSSCVFAALHVQYTWFGILTVALIGLLLGVIRMRTNTTTAIAVHVAYDVLVAVTTGR